MTPVLESRPKNVGLARLLRWAESVRRVPQTIVALAWWPIRAIYMRVAPLRRGVAWVRMHRKKTSALILLVAHVLGVISSINVLGERRTPQGAIAWIVSLNTFPYIAVPLYWTIGETDYSEYAIAYRARRSEGSRILDRLNDGLAKSNLGMAPETDTQQLFANLVNLPLTRGNDAEILVDGVETFEAIFESIQQATHYVLVEFYILQDDQLGQRLKRLLIEKAHQGVIVKVLYDEYGSRNLTEQYIEELRSAGVKVHGFNPPFADVSPTRLNFRNHRKIVIVDGLEAFVGGHNVGDEYYHGDEYLGLYRDTHVHVRGPLVQSCQIVFAEDWYAVSEELLEHLDWDARAAGESDMVGLCLPTGPADRFETASLFFLHAINSAKNRIWIASPYFVPDQQMVTALQLAALRGVEIRILIPLESDAKLAWLSSFSYLPELEAAGIKTFRYRDRFMHQKAILIDDAFSAIGTANFDNRSFRLNFEVMMVLFDPTFVEQTATMLENDFRNSQLAPATEMTEASYLFQLIVQGARLLAPIQ